LTFIGFSCLKFLSRLFRAGLGIVPFRRTLRHFSPYTFKQAPSNIHIGDFDGEL